MRMHVADDSLMISAITTAIKIIAIMSIRIILEAFVRRPRRDFGVRSAYIR